LADDPEQTRQLALQGATVVRQKYDQAYLASRFVSVIRQAFVEKARKS